MKHFVFTPDTCHIKITEFIKQIFEPLKEVRISENIYCSGNWKERLGAEIDSKRNYIYLDSLKLESEEETIAFRGLFERALLMNVTLIISLSLPLPEGFREHITELTAL